MKQDKRSNCINCAKQLTEKQQSFCSMLCRNKVGAKATRNNALRYRMRCQACGDSFDVMKSRLKKAKCCSMKCRGKYSAIKRWGNKGEK